MVDERPTVRGLLAARAGDPAPGLVAAGQTWSWAEHVGECARRAHWLAAHLDQAAPPHVGLLGDNTADFAGWLGACGLSGSVAVGLNPTRADDELVRDATFTRCQLVLVDAAHADRGEALARAGLVVRSMGDPGLAEQVAVQPAEVPDVAVGPDDLFMLIFTSGTTSDPKAVRCSQGKLAHSGSMVGLMMGLGDQDVVLVSMPMFHSNAVIAGWLAAISSGARMVLRDRFSASGFVADLRDHGVTYANYVGKTLSYVMTTPAQPGDGDLPLRVVFGNEANEADIHRFAERFGCRVVDAYGSTEGGISLLRTDETPPGSLGIGIGDIRVLDEEGNECPRAVLDDRGQVANALDAVGELVNLDGPGGFEGYWDNPEADAQRLRSGRFHSGDLAWRDADGFFWFAGRTGDWLRVDGENLAIAPIERVLCEHPDVIQATVVAVPDTTAGDQVLAWVEVGSPSAVEAFDIRAFEQWCRARADLGPKQFPKFVRVEATLPRTPTNKVVRAQLRSRGVRPGPGVWWRPDRQEQFRPVAAADLDDWARAFAATGRQALLPALTGQG